MENKDKEGIFTSLLHPRKYINQYRALPIISCSCTDTDFPYLSATF